MRIGLKGTHLCEKEGGRGEGGRERGPTAHEWEKEGNELRASPMITSRGKLKERERGEARRSPPMADSCQTPRGETHWGELAHR